MSDLARRRDAALLPGFTDSVVVGEDAEPLGRGQPRPLGTRRLHEEYGDSKRPGGSDFFGDAGIWAVKLPTIGDSIDRDIVPAVALGIASVYVGAAKLPEGVSATQMNLATLTRLLAYSSSRQRRDVDGPAPV